MSTFPCRTTAIRGVVWIALSLPREPPCTAGSAGTGPGAGHDTVDAAAGGAPRRSIRAGPAHAAAHAPGSPPTRSAPRPPAARPVVAATPPGSPGGPYVAKDVNIRIDATITESRAEQPLGRKVISVTLRDGDTGSVRSSALVPQPKFGGPPDARGSLTRAPLNMDATVFLRDSGRVLARVTLECQTAAASRMATAVINVRRSTAASGKASQ